MNNKPVAYMDKKGFVITNEESAKEHGFAIPLYTHPAEHNLGIAEAIGFEKGHEAGRQLGMKQERALWNLSESTQEIMNTHPVSQYKAITNTKIEPTVVSYTHPVKELTDEEITICMGSLPKYNSEIVDEDLVNFARAILRKAQENGNV